MMSEEVDHTPHRAMDSGTFGGHLWPGCVYVIFGCITGYNTLFRYHVARRQAVLKGSDSKKLRYKNMLFPSYSSGCGQAKPLEAIAIVVIAVAACIGEVFSYHKGFPVIVAVHHMVILFFFGMMGLAKILHHYKFAVPPSSDYAMFIVSVAVYAFLFSNHLFNKEIVNRQMHLMLVYFNLIVILCTILELMHKRNVTVALGRIVLMMAQGFWMSTIAFIDYPLSFMHAFDLNDHTLLEVVTTLGVVVVAAALMIAFTVNFIVARRVKNMNLATVNRIVALTHYQRALSGSKGEAKCPLISDSDYEI